ncbi:MAG: hypothetical protein DDT39_00333 [Firmicutes bacterium]|nr:hypothetical protein [candidate division NPL-UPA2 bacterium]
MVDKLSISGSSEKFVAGMPRRSSSEKPLRSVNVYLPSSTSRSTSRPGKRRTASASNLLGKTSAPGSITCAGTRQVIAISLSMEVMQRDPSSAVRRSPWGEELVLDVKTRPTVPAAKIRSSRLAVALIVLPPFNASLRVAYLMLGGNMNIKLVKVIVVSVEGVHMWRKPKVVETPIYGGKLTCG